MKFYKGQKVICISKKKEWDSAINNFDTNLMIAVDSHRLPEENKEYVVDCAMELHYNKRCYISIKGFDLIFDESGFTESDKLSRHDTISNMIGKAMSLNN